MSKTVGNAFYNDPRVQEAKKLLAEALSDHQRKITGLKPANPELVDEYKKSLEDFGKNRGGALFYPYLGSGFGNGAWVELMDGSTKLDFITGIGVHYMGHGHPGVINATVDGAISNTVMQGHLQQNYQSAELCELLTKQSAKYGAKLGHCFLTSSGVMANENALKIAFQKRFPANRVLAFEKCFMGRTLACAQITDKAAYRQGLPQTIQADYVPFYDSKDHDGSIKKSVDVLKKHLARHPKEYAVFCMEVIQGEAGALPGHPEFFEALAKVCQENNISVFVDEVQTFGRTSELFAFQYFKLDKYVDIVTVGKNSQVCATLFKEDHKPGPGLIAQTFTSSSAAISAGLYIVNTIVNEGYLGKEGKIETFHKYFADQLDELHKKYPTKIEGPWGIGSLVGTIVMGGDNDKSTKFTKDLFNNGLMSFTAGANPTRVRFLLPVGSLTLKDIDEAIKILDKTLAES